MNTVLENISIERLEQIERERQQTLSDPKYHEWVKQLNVSQSHRKQEGLLNARHMMSLWDPNRYGRKTVIDALLDKISI